MNEQMIFLDALSKSSLAERNTFLDEACAGNPQLRTSVEQLIRAHDNASDFLEVPVLVNSKDNRTDSSANISMDADSPTQIEETLSFLEPCDQSGILGRLGPYLISEIIGRGGMGIVLRGHDARLNRVIAIKVLAPELASNSMARKRFLREAQAAAAVSHTHVVTTHAIDEVKSFPYIVMEYIAGCSLQERIDRDDLLDVKSIVRIARQTALGLAAAHEQGLIHRDIKPANILLENGVERVKLSDFGLARAVDDVSTTQTGMVAGTPQYMSPEQAQGQPVDHRSDLFSLGCVMYAMCTGRSPFRASTAVAALRRVCDDQPRPIEEINPEIPDWLIAIINRLLAKRPEDRYQSAAEIAELSAQGLAHLQQPSGEFQAELKKLVQESGGRIRVRPASTAMGSMDSRQTSAFSRLAETSRTRRTAVVAATILTLLCLTVGLTEATGVSQVGEFLATILHISTPHGTLKVEVDDPGVEVTIDGEEVVITGAGPQEVRLKPGVYRLLARKDGKLISQELVTISREGKQVVKIGFEPSPDPPERMTLLLNRDAPLSLHRIDEVARFEGPANVQYAARFSPTGEAILAYTGADEGARVLAMPDGQEQVRFPGAFGAAAWLPDTKRIVTGSHHQENDQNTLVVWDAETGRQLWSSPPVTGVFHDLDVSADGRFVVSGHGQWWDGYHDRDQTVRIWDLEERKLLHEMKGHADQVMAVAMIPDGKMVVSGSRDQTVRLWDAKTGKEIRQFEGLGTEVFSVATSPDGQFVLAGYGPHEETGIQGRMIDDPKHCVAVFWEKASGKEVRRFVGHSGCINSVGFSPDGELVVTASGEAFTGEPSPDGGSKKTRDNTVRLWETSTGKQLASLEHRTSLESASFSPDGRLLLTGEWLLMHLYRLPAALHQSAMSESLDTFTYPLLVSSNRSGDFDIYRIPLSNPQDAGDTETIVAADGDQINLTSHPAEDTGPACSPDGTRIAFCSSRSGNLDIWLMNSDGSGLTQLTEFPGTDRTPCWSPDGKQIAFVRHLPGSNWEIFVMDADGSHQMNLTNHPAKEADPAWSPDGKSIAYSFDSDGTHLYLMDADGSDPRLLSGRKGSFTYPAWSPDGSQLVFTGWANEVDGDLELFIIDADGSNERQLTQMNGLNTFAAWSPDGTTIAFEHRHPNLPGLKATVYLIGTNGSDLTAVSEAEAHIGYGGGRPAWQPISASIRARASGN